MVSIIIPNYNGENLLKKNLPKIQEALDSYKDVKTEIIVADDASTDGSAAYIKNEILSIRQAQDKNIKNTYKNLKIKLIQNDKNLGFSSTVNRGAKEAEGDVLILLNTDIVPEKEFLKYVLPHFEDEKMFAVGCMDKSIDLPAGEAGEGKVVLRGRGLGRWEKGFLVHRRGEVDKTDTLWVSGGSGAFRKSIFQKLGGLNELYNPFYWEDIDISYRAQKAGYKVLFEKKSIVIHEHSEGSIKKHYSEFKIRTIAYKNQFVFVWINATDLDLQLLHLLWLPYHFLKALIRLDVPFFLGFLKAFILLPKIIKSSFRTQRLFIKSDKEVLR